MVLNNRELASLIWLAVAAAWVLSRQDLRSGIAGILKSLASPPLLLPLLGLLGWIALEILGRKKAGPVEHRPRPQHRRLDRGHRAGALFQRQPGRRRLSVFSQNRKECALRPASS